MTVKPLDKNYETFSAGDIVVYQGYGWPYGVRVVKKIFLERTNEYHCVCVEGEVLGGKWSDTYSGDDILLVLKTDKQLREYEGKWVPGDFKSGDVLKDQDGTLYLYVSENKVWNLSKGTNTTLASWTRVSTIGQTWNGRKFTQVKNAAGENFSKVIKMESTSL